jgi:UDP-N-acetylglucosamine 1-carboxyvinyltransferase
MVTVTGTENLMMAAALADGETVLENAAREPEIPDLAEMLIKMGAQIEGTAPPHPHLGRGAPARARGRHRIVPDRIEAGTFLCAVAATGGDVVLRDARATHLDAVIDKLREAGVTITAGEDWIRIQATARPKAVSFRTTEYPASRPTCRPSSWRQLRGRGHGADRRDHLREPLHARQRADPPGRADRRGRQHRHGHRGRAPVGRHRDGHRPARLGQPGHRRPGGRGQTTVDRIYHLDRGYDRMEDKLRAIGANIERVSERTGA